MGEGSTVGPTLVDPCPRPRAPKAREARGHRSTSVGPIVDPSPMDPPPESYQAYMSHGSGGDILGMTDPVGINWPIEKKNSPLNMAFCSIVSVSRWQGCICCASQYPQPFFRCLEWPRRLWRRLWPPTPPRHQRPKKS